MNNLSEILKLSVSERILLVEAIWDSIANENKKPVTYQLSDEQIRILEEEISDYSKNPDEGSSWEEIKNKILRKK